MLDSILAKPTDLEKKNNTEKNYADKKVEYKEFDRFDDRKTTSVGLFFSVILVCAVWLVREFTLFFIRASSR